jgi:hypothetical protein
VTLTGGEGGGGAAGSAPDAAEHPPERVVRTISRPGHLARWAFIGRPVLVHRAPAHSSRVLGRLGTKTADGTSELVMAVQRWRGEDGEVWLRVRTPLLPTGTVGWIPRSAVTPYHRVTTWVVVDRAVRRLALVRDGRVVFRAPVGIGKAGSPTPSGRFYIRSRLLDLNDPAYGPAAFGTSARSTTVTDWPGERAVGIHGTDQPELIPGRISHGCIRMRNEDIQRLVRLMPVGTPLTIL